jgi:hypothetical protein
VVDDSLVLSTKGKVMSGYLVIDKDGNIKRVHNLHTGLYLVKHGYAEKVVDDWTGISIIVNKEEVPA